MTFTRTPLGVFRGKINNRLEVIKREESINRYHVARRRKLRDPKKFQETMEKRRELGLPSPQRSTPEEAMLRMHNVSKKKVSLPTLKFAADDPP